MNAQSTQRDRRNQILDSAADLLSSAGVNSSITEIAAAAGVQAGSLYHHFESKDAILVELVKRYLDDVDGVARTASDRLSPSRAVSTHEQVEALGAAISDCANRNRAALLILLYEPPKGTDDLLAGAASQSPLTLQTAMLDALQADPTHALLRSGVAPDTLADQLCRVLLHVGLGDFQDVPGASQIPALRCQILLDGIALKAPSNADLDGSDALHAADRILDGLDTATEPDDERLARIRAVAGSEFGRRGYDATTIKEIAVAADVSKARVYRLVGSKDELLTSIIESFTVKAETGWAAITATDASPIEKLDALIWFNLNVVDRFRDEYDVQLACLRDSPPSTTSLGVSFGARLNDLKAVLAQGIDDGEIALQGSTPDIRAWALFELLWMPENLVQTLGRRGALAFARDTVLRGAAQRGG